MKIQVVDTRDDCIQQVTELQRLTGLDHLVTEFGFGAMPHHEASSTCASLPIASCRRSSMVPRSRIPHRRFERGVACRQRSAGIFAPARPLQKRS